MFKQYLKVLLTLVLLHAKVECQQWNATSLLPSAPNCGISLNDRVIGGEMAGLDEYPWLALLQYRTKRGNLSFGCGGALINNRYILTAAHCVTGLPRNFEKLVSIRLGEYNIETPEDCMTINNKLECIDPPIDIPVQDIILHPEYKQKNSNNKAHDIALVRLAKEVEKDYMKPICLPTPDLVSLKSGDTVYVAGWGTIDRDEGKLSNTKMKLEIPFVDELSCDSFYKRYRATLSDGQLCAGGEKGKDTCRGDSGGPLMKHISRFIYCEGVVSFGINCGLEGYPGVYTKVREYMDWIVSNLKP